MSLNSIGRIGENTVLVAVTGTSTNKAVGGVTKEFLIIQNLGSNPVFINSVAASNNTVVYPTTTTGQNGAIIPANTSMVYKKNNPTDAYVAVICGAGLTSTLSIQSSEGE